MGAHHSKEWLYSAIEAENIELINKILYVPQKSSNLFFSIEKALLGEPANDQGLLH